MTEYRIDDGAFVLSLSVVEVVLGSDYVNLCLEHGEDSMWMRLSRRDFGLFQQMCGTVGSQLLERHWEKKALENSVQITEDPTNG